MKNKYIQKKWLGTLALGALMCFSGCHKEIEDELNDVANYTVIPDKNFEQALINLKYDDVADGKILTQKASKVSTLDLKNKGIISLEGISAFKNLETLELSQNKLTKVSLIKNEKLLILTLGSNKLQAIDLSKNPLLKGVDLSNNKLKSLKLDANLKLLELDLDSNELLTIDLTKNTSLVELKLSNNKLTSISGLTKLEGLTHITASKNKLKTLDLSKSLKLVKLQLDSNELTVLNLSTNLKLQSLNVKANKLDQLDLSSNRALTQVDASANEKLTCIGIVAEDIEKASKWTISDTQQFSTDCENVGYTAIPDENFEKALIALGHDDVKDGRILTEKAMEIKQLDLHEKEISNLTGLQAFEMLTDLNAGINAITQVDFSKNLNLKTINLGRNKLTSIDLSMLSNLTVFDAPVNQLKTVNLENNTALTRLHLYNNKITQINLSKNVELDYLSVAKNEIQNLDLSKNVKLESVSVVENKSLSCVQVATKEIADGANAKTGNYTNWTKGGSQRFSNNCGAPDPSLYTAISDVNFEKALIALGHDDVKDGRILTAKAKEVKQLDVHEKEISNLTGLQAFENITDLNGQGNSIKAIDLSKNLKLKTINLSDNQLTGVDISPLTNLTVFNAKSNSIQSLDVSANEKLNSLFLKDNKLQHIDLSKNTLLRDLILEANKIKHLDLSKNTGLKAVNIKGNAELTCVKIADNFTEEGANSGINAYSGWIKDSGQRFSKDCSAPNPSDYTAIPDPTFEEALIDLGHDDVKDGKILTATAKEVTLLNLSNKGIKSLKGIRAFTKLTTLYAKTNGISQIDLSANIKLETIDLQNNLLTSIDVSKNTKLVTLNISNNALASIDVSKLTELQALWIIDCGITQVNISRNTALTKFMAARNSLTSLDLSKNTSIQTLWLTDNKLKTLDLSNNTNLLRIQIQKNTLTDLDLSANTKLLEVLVSQNPKLNCIGVSRGQTSNGQWVKDASQSFSVDCSAPDPSLFTAIPDTKFEEALIELGLDDVKDGRILTATAKEVIELNIYRKGISKLTGIQAFTKLTRLYAGANSISQVDLSKNLNLEILKLDRNQLSSIDISKLTKLTQFDPSVNQLQSVDLANSLALTIVNLYSNKISQIDVSKNVKLTYLAVSTNELQDLDISKNVALTNVHVGENSSLTCIQVASQDIADGANAKTGRYTNWNKDDSQSFSVDCSAPNPLDFTAIPDLVFEQRLITLGWDDVQDGKVLTANIKDRKKFTLQYSPVADLTGIGAFKALETLNLEGCFNLPSVDLSENINITSIAANYAKFTSLDLSKLLKLNYIMITEGQSLTNIKFPEGANSLKHIHLGYAKLTSLDLSGITQLRNLYIQGNPDLSCIKLASQEMAGKANSGERLPYSAWSKDSHHTFSANCSAPNPSDYTAIPDTKFEYALIELGFDDVKDGRILTATAKEVIKLNIYRKGISKLTGIQAFTKLTRLYAGANSISQVDLSANIKLETIELHNNLLTSIDVSKNTKLVTLNISHNALASIDVSKLTELKALWIIDCGITQVNISRNTALTKFMAVRNSLTSLDLSKNTSIQTLWLTDNKLKTLDLSNNTNLLHIQIQKNTLTDLDLSANTKLGQVLVSHNPKLNCIGVSRGQTSIGKWVKDASQNFSVNCAND